MANINCARCPELAACRTQIVSPTPCPPGGLLAIGEAAGADEDRIGEGFVGRAGKTLDAILLEQGVPRDGYGRANICRCRPPGNRRPTKDEASACLPLLMEFIAETKPRVLLLVGSTATAYFLGDGSLFQRIKMSQQPGGDWVDPSICHPAIRPMAQLGLLAVPMPHTSGLAWNRKAPDGRRWSEIGRQQVAFAVSFVKRG